MFQKLSQKIFCLEKSMWEVLIENQPRNFAIYRKAKPIAMRRLLFAENCLGARVLGPPGSTTTKPWRQAV